MTLPQQRTRALEGGHELILKVLGDASASPELKDLARWAHRHYPSPREIQSEARRQASVYQAQTNVFPGPWLAPPDALGEEL